MRVSRAQTNMRGELLAIYIAIQDTDPRRTLIIHTDIEVAIRIYCYWVEGCSYWRHGLSASVDTVHGRLECPRQARRGPFSCTPKQA